MDEDNGLEKGRRELEEQRERDLFEEIGSDEEQEIIEKNRNSFFVD